MAVRRPKKAAQESRLFDRELSWLEWNARVLEMAGDERVPLLERLRFTAIFSSNLDEFCMVRVAELLEAVRDSPNRPRTAGDLLPSEVLDRVGTRMRELVERQSAMLAELLAELREPRASRSCPCPRSCRRSGASSRPCSTAASSPC